MERTLRIIDEALELVDRRAPFPCDDAGAALGS